MKMKKDNEIVNSAKGLRVSNVVGSANNSEQWPLMGPRVELSKELVKCQVSKQF